MIASPVKNSMDNYIWGNENPDGINYDHKKGCKCINCEIKFTCPYCLENGVDEEHDMCFECRMKELGLREEE